MASVQLGNGLIQASTDQYTKKTVVEHLNSNGRSVRKGSIVSFESCGKLIVLLVKEISMDVIKGYDAMFNFIEYDIHRFENLKFAPVYHSIVHFGGKFYTQRAVAQFAQTAADCPDLRLFLEQSGDDLNALSDEVKSQIQLNRFFELSGVPEEVFDLLDEIEEMSFSSGIPSLRGTRITKCPLMKKYYTRSNMIEFEGNRYSAIGVNTVGLEVKCSECGKTFLCKEAAMLFEELFCPECDAKRPRCVVCRRKSEVTIAGLSLCRSHALDRDSKDYHENDSRHAPIFFGKTDPDFPLYLGVELEVDTLLNSDKPAFPGMATRLAKRELDYEKVEYCRDGSLSSAGFEMISQPKSIYAWRLSREKYHTTFENLVECGIRGHDSQRAGFHIHVSRAAFGSDEAKAFVRMNVLFHRHFKQILIFSRRTKERMSSYAQYTRSVTDVPKFTQEHLGELSAWKSMRVGHHSMIAVDGEVPTIEFRAFRSTLNIETFMATLEFVYGICKYVKTHSFDECNEISWDDLLAWIDSEDVTNYWNRISKVGSKRSSGEASNNGDDCETEKCSKHVAVSEEDFKETFGKYRPTEHYEDSSNEAEDEDESYLAV
jgi:hypothetical protein